ncbi:MAG: DHA2 family efflux MFS transporter permease subunit [Pseudomonadota bacterium]
MSDAALVAGAPAAVGPSALRQGLLLGTLTFVTMLYAMTVTIANVSLPQMQGSLSSTPDQIAWIVTFNIVATAVVTPIAGWLAAWLGRRRLMVWGILGFGAASVACGLATSVPELVAYRIAQGAFGAPLVPLCQAIVIEAFPEEKRQKMMSIWGTGVILGPIIAPALGGVLSEAYGWRWVFFMLVPFTAVALAGVLTMIPRSDETRDAKLDWTGFCALAVAITALQLALDRGERAGWLASSEILIYLAACLSALWIFGVRNAISRTPFLNPALLRDRNFVVGIVLIFIFGMLNFTPITLLPTLLQTVSGFPDSIIGQILSARGAGTLVGFSAMFLAGGLDPRIPMMIGLVLQAWSGWLMAGFSVDVSIGQVLWASALQGLGVGLMWIPLSVVTFATLPKAMVPDGTAIFHLLRNMGSSIFISITVALVIRQSAVNRAELTAAVTPFREAFEQPGIDAALDLGDPASMGRIAGEIGRQATMIGYINAFLFFAICAAAAAPLVLMVRTRRG